MKNDPKRRKVTGIRPPPRGHWVGDGFPVRTMVSYSEDGGSISPFLLLDYAAPYEFPADGRRRGVGEHPHRGFETVTIAFQGEVEHRDSAGNQGRIGPGDIQWMTAASGIVHEEMHGRDFSRRGGTFEPGGAGLDGEMTRCLHQLPPHARSPRLRRHEQIVQDPSPSRSDGRERRIELREADADAVLQSKVHNRFPPFQPLAEERPGDREVRRATVELPIGIE